MDNRLIAEINLELQSSFPCTQPIIMGEYWEPNYDIHLNRAHGLGPEYCERNVVYLLLILEAMESEENSNV